MLQFSNAIQTNAFNLSINVILESLIKNVSHYDQEIQQLYTADQPRTSQGRAIEQDIRKTVKVNQ